MDLSIIIPSFNTKRLLDQCLASIEGSLKHSKLTYEIIVVDNASTDGTVELLEKKYPQVLKILNKENVGYGRANNQGIRKARGTFVLLLNSDTRVLDNAIETLLDFCQRKPGCFAGGKLYNVDSTPQASCGPMYSLPVVAVMLYAKGDALGISRYSPAVSREVDWVSGACLMGRRRAFLDVGLFDEDIFLYMEEIEFLYRARRVGHRVWFVADARFIHVGAASSAQRRTPVINIYRGLVYFYRKHRGPGANATLRLFLWVKALAAIILGRIMGNRELTLIYEIAMAVV